MLIHRISFFLVATFLIGASTASFVRVAHAGQQSQTQDQSSQNSTSQIDLSQLFPVDIYFNDTLVWSQVLYGSVTQYLFIPQGQWIVKVNSSASNMSSGSSRVDINQTISITQEANYTLAIFQSQPSGNQGQPGNETASTEGQSQSQTQSQTQQGQGQQSQSQTQTQQQSQGTGLGESGNQTQPSNETGSQASLTIGLFLEQLNATSSDAYVKLYNFVPNTQISLVLLNQSSSSNNMSTGGENESTNALNSNPPAPSTNESTSGQQTIIPSVPFGNASDYTAIPQTVALQQLALLVDGQPIPLDDFKMNSSYLNYSFVQNFDFRFLRMGDKYSIFAMPAVPTVREFYLFGNDTMSSVSTSNSSPNNSSSGSTDLITQITRDDLPVAVSYIRFVSGVPNTQFSPVLDNQTITPVSIGNASNFYVVYSGLHVISQTSQGGSNQTLGSENQTSSTNSSSSSASQLVLLTPSSISDYVLAGSESNTTTALIPSYITFPLDLNESAVKLVNLVSDASLTLMITSQNQSMSSNVSTSEVMFLNASKYVVLNSSSYSFLLMQNNQTIARLDNVQLTPTTYFTVFAISGAAQQNNSSQNETASGNTTTSQVQLVIAMDTQTIPLPIGSYARFIVSLSSASQSSNSTTNETTSNGNTSSQTNSTQGAFVVMVDDVLEVNVNNGNVTSYISMPSGQRNITLMNENGDIIASSIVVITPNSTQSILIFGQQQSVQFAVAQDTRRAAMSMDSVRMRLVNLDINSQSISLVQSQSTLISNVSSGSWSAYQDIMAQNLQLSSLSISGPSGQSPIEPLQSSSQQSVSQNQNQSQTLNSYFAYSIIAQSGASASQNSSNSTMGVIVSDSTFQLQDICFVRFVLASPDAPAVDIFMNDLLVYSNLMPQNSSFYIPVIKGLFNVSVVPSMSSGSTNQTMGEGSLNQTLGNETTPTNQSTSAPLLSVLVSFQTSSFFTFAIIEPSQNMSYLVLEDKVIPSKQMANESAQVRVVNLAFDTQGLSVSASSSLGQNISIANDLDYLLASDYVNIQPGQYSFLVSQGTSGSALRNISMEILARNFYTIWITNANQTVPTNRSHQGAFIDRQITIDNGAYWLDDIEDWAGNVKDWENDQFEPISSSNNSTGGSTGNFTGNSTSSNQTTTSSPSNSFMFGMGRYDDQVFFGEFIFNTTSMNISETESSRQTRMIMGQWDRMYRAFYLAKGDPFGLGLALPRKV